MKLAVFLSILCCSLSQAAEKNQIRRLSTDALTARRNAVEQTGLEFFVPQLIVGGEWTSTIRLTNKGSTPIPPSDVFFIDNTGQPLQATFTTVPGNETVTDAGFSFTLGNNGILELEFRGGEDTEFGYALVSPDACPQEADCTLYGEVILKNSNASRPDFESVFPLEAASELQYLLWDHRAGFSTVLYLVSANLSVNNVQLEFRDTNDALISAVPLQMHNETQILTLPTLAPDTVGKTGTLIIRATNVEGEFPFIVATALRINPSNSFTPVRAFTPKPPLTPAPPTVGGGGPSGLGSFSCAAVEGALLFATDGQFLGKITSNRFDSDSIGNQYGSYGSKYSSTSIFNPYGQYGSQFSSESAFNPSASNPPVLYINNRGVAYLTVNQALSPRIVPQQIYPCIGRT